MKKEKLLELSDTLRGIAEGEEWEYCCFIGPNEQWFSSMTGTDPLSMAARGQNIRLKPQQPPLDPYAELKAAHAAGRTIQYKWDNDRQWFDCYGAPHWTINPEIQYRIKPEPRKVPLGPDDVKVGDQLRFSETEDILADGEHEGSIILSVTKFGILVASCKMGESVGFVEMFTWERLMPHEIKRSTDSVFQPCHKLVEE